jgi:hypothetical protein
LAGLSGHSSDAIEVSVVVQDDESCGLGGSGDEQVRDFSASLMFGGQEALNLFGASHIGAGRLDELKLVQSFGEPIPLVHIAGRVADL